MSERAPPLALRIAAGVMCALFALSVAVQWNDPDPLSWMTPYAVAALLAGLCAAGRLPLWPNALAAVGFGVTFALWAPSLLDARGEAFTTFEMRAPADEEPREAIGLALCAAWSAVQTVAARRVRT